MKKPARTTSTVSTTTTTTTSTTTSITTSAPTIFPKKSRSKRTKQSAQITLSKRHASTLSPFISTDISLKHHKKSPLPFAHHRTCFTRHPTTISTSSAASTTKTLPNTKLSTTPVQSTSIAPIQNTPTTIPNTTTPTATIYTTTIIQKKILIPHEINISLLARLRTPLTIPFSSSTLPSHFFLCMLQELQQWRLW